MAKGKTKAPTGEINWEKIGGDIARWADEHDPTTILREDAEVISVECREPKTNHVVVMHFWAPAYTD